MNNREDHSDEVLFILRCEDKPEMVWPILGSGPGIGSKQEKMWMV
jgi:hypothetical protein